MASAFLAPLPLSTTTLKPPCIATRDSRINARMPKRATMTISPPEKQTTTKPAKHPIPSAFDFRNQWYPITWTDDITDTPHAFTLWGRPLVLFRDSATDNVIVMDDVCPHRAAALSDGMLQETETGTQIRCGYHGWAFDSTGKCTDIPYAKRVPKKACMQKIYPTASWMGLVFVWFGDKPADESLLPIPEKYRVLDDNVITFRNTRRILPTSFIAAVENVLDTAHVNWVHHNTGQGDRARIPRDGGMDSTWTEDGLLIANVLIGNGQAGYRVRVTHQPPSSVFYDAPFGFLLFLWHRPITHDECEIFSINGFVNPPWTMRLEQALAPRWRECSIANMILDGDGVTMRAQMVELQRKNRDGLGRSWKKMYFLANGKWDTAVREFHEFLDINAVGMPWECAVNGVLTKLSLREVNDRWTFHTRDCVSCSGALKWSNRLLWTSAVVMALGAVLLVSTALVKLAGVGGGSVLGAGVFGLVLCTLSGVLGMLMIKMKTSLTYTTKAYELGH